MRLPIDYRVGCIRTKEEQTKISAISRQSISVNQSTPFPLPAFIHSATCLGTVPLPSLPGERQVVPSLFSSLLFARSLPSAMIFPGAFGFD